MPWVRVPGIKGLVYQPQHQTSTPRKHPCPDCYFCQMCSDTRCSECQQDRTRTNKKCQQGPENNPQDQTSTS